MRRYKDWLVIGVGSLLVTAWTLFRLFTKSVNFDMTGQQLLARQWLDGFADGSVMAPTNYIVKMLLVYMPGEALGIDPHTLLVGSTILINVLTFAGLYMVIKKLLTYFTVPVSSMFYGGMLWLAGIAGSVFWIEFSNSRNLEIVAGLSLLYICLLFYQKATTWRAAAIVALAGITFFADPMQLYIIPAIMVGYSVIDTVLHKKSWTPLLRITGLLAVGLVVAWCLTFTVQQLTHVTFFGVSSLQQSLAIFGQPLVVATETAKNLIRLVAGTNEMGVWRQALNIGLVGVMSGGVIFAVMKKRLPKPPVIFVAVWIVVVVGVYITSGQPTFQIDTSRYLILFAPAAVFAGSLLVYNKGVLYRVAAVILWSVVLINAASLIWFTATSWRTTLPSDGPLKTRMSYVQNANFAYGYASMDTAIPGTYLFGKHKAVLLPLSCAYGRLHRATLFYDQKVFTTLQAGGSQAVPLILDGDAIRNQPHLCSEAAILDQLGLPTAKHNLASGDLVLIYDAVTIAERTKP